jgi:hypothetical protein
VHKTDKVIIDSESGDFLGRWRESKCPKQKEWKISNFDNPQVKKILSDLRYTNALAELSKALGKPLSIRNFTYYYDNLKCMDSSGYPVP